MEIVWKSCYSLGVSEAWVTNVSSLQEIDT